MAWDGRRRDVLSVDLVEAGASQQAIDVPDVHVARDDTNTTASSVPTVNRVERVVQLVIVRDAAVGQLAIMTHLPVGARRARASATRAPRVIGCVRISQRGGRLRQTIVQSAASCTRQPRNDPMVCAAVSTSSTTQAILGGQDS